MKLLANNSRRLAALRALILLLFLPAHVAFVLLIDLNFIPTLPGPSSLQQGEDQGPKKERLRLHLHRHSEVRAPAIEAKLVFRDLNPWSLPPLVRPVLSAGESVPTTQTKPASILLWLAATPQNHRAPPV